MVNKYGEWALVTGASSGIGEVFAGRLALIGFNLILIARREERLTALSNSLTSKHNIKTEIIPCDLVKPGSIELIKTKTANLDVGLLINNAGFGSTGEFNNCDAQTEGDMVILNCYVPIMLTHHFLDKMIARKKGGIIFLGSSVAFQPTPYMSTYSATKVFNLFMGETLWYEMKKHNIDVLALNPGGTNTEFQRIASVGTGPFVRTPEQVVTTALKNLGKKPSVIDGFINKTMAVSGKLFPRRLIVSIAGTIAKSLYNAKGKKS